MGAMGIRGNNLNITEPVKIHPDVDICVTGMLRIDQYAVINKGFKATCRNLHIGRHCWIGENVSIKYGAADNPWADVVIGDHTGLMDGVLINASRPVTIGTGCGLGVETQIWTHSGWLPITQGFPKQKEEAVTIGDNVWLPSRCQVLPGVSIGDNVVVGIGSVVNRNLPPGCFAAGHPAKVKIENAYPVATDITSELLKIVALYQSIASDKGFAPSFGISENVVRFHYKDEVVEFNCNTMQFTPDKLSDYAEDFRDYLRRYGLKFFGGGFFKSLPTIAHKRLYGMEK